MTHKKFFFCLHGSKNIIYYRVFIVFTTTKMLKRKTNFHFLISDLSSKRIGQKKNRNNCGEIEKIKKKMQNIIDSIGF